MTSADRSSVDRKRPRTSWLASVFAYGMLPAHIVLMSIWILAWHFLTKYKIMPPFFFGQPLKVFDRLVDWFISGSIYNHLYITLLETILSFIGGMVSGIVIGLWLGLSPMAGKLVDPYVKALNAMPRVILAPIFIVWFGLGIWSKVTLGMSLVFCIVFFNVYQGVREVSPTILANARMLGANQQYLLRKVYLPSAMTWVFSSLHTSVGMAFAGAVVGEYMGSTHGIGYLILEAEGTFDINTVYAGIITLTIFALILDAAVSLVERRLLAWQPRVNA
jgi:NitT/TauT family transport system permease protein